MTALSREDIEVWLFDLDNTLYPAECRLFDQVSRRIRLYIEERFSLDPEAAHRMQKDYYRRFGTTMNGLMTQHGIDPGPFLDFVHDIDVSGLTRDPDLARALDSLPGKKLIYTNASTAHAERVLERLGIAGAFDAIHDIVASAYRPKPKPEPYGDLVTAQGLPPARTAFIEDTARNLGPAHDLGMVTVWLNHGHPDTLVDIDRKAIHHEIDDLTAWLSNL